MLQAHACLDNPSPKPATQPTLAYDRQQLPVLASHLQHEDSTVVHAAAVSLRRIVTLADSAYKIHEAGLLDILAEKAQDHESSVIEIAQISMECLKLCMQSPALRSVTAMHSDVLVAIRFCMYADDSTCRREAYGALAAAVEFHETANALVEAGFIRDVVLRIGAECDALPASKDLLNTCLLALRRLTSHTTLPVIDGALAENAVPTLFQVLQNPDACTDTVTRVAEIVLAIAVSAAGKVACIAVEGGVQLLLEMLAKSSANLMAQLLGCLMVRSITPISTYLSCHCH